MGFLRWGRGGFFWWVAWVVVCVPAGALAGVGLIEFNWGGPPYDGGFAGYLLLFGGFLAVGQAPFFVAFVPRLLCRGDASRDGGGSGDGLLAGPVAGAAVWWIFAGFLGWAVGSMVKVGLPISYSPFSPSLPLWAFSTALPWLCVGIAQAPILASVDGGSGRAGTGVGNARAVASLVRGVCWALASAVGGVLVETWMHFQIAAGGGSLTLGMVDSLRGLGVAENVAQGVIPYALSIPVAYGAPTGVVLSAIYLTVVGRHVGGG